MITLVLRRVSYEENISSRRIISLRFRLKVKTSYYKKQYVKFILKFLMVWVGLLIGEHIFSFGRLVSWKCLGH